jgi:hypothetical protein
LFLAGRSGAVVDARSALNNLERWKGENLSIYAALIGHAAARRDGNGDQAKVFLDDARARCDKSMWPYPIIAYLRAEIDEPKLLAAAADSDSMADVRCFLGLDVLLRGNKETAIGHFRWVKAHGREASIPFAISLAELERLGMK